jgi:hypothetical protein
VHIHTSVNATLYPLCSHNVHDMALALLSLAPVASFVIIVWLLLPNDPLLHVLRCCCYTC